MNAEMISPPESQCGSLVSHLELEETHIQRENRLRENARQEETNKIRNGMINFRIAFSIVILILLSINANLGIAFPKRNPDCITDNIHNLTYSVTHFLKNHTSTKLLITLVLSLLIDAAVVYKCINWIMTSESWRFVISLILFYILKAISRWSIQVKIPSSSVFEYPGIPAISISYFSDNDLVYTAVPGLLMICGMDYMKESYRFMGLLSYSLCVLHGLFLILCHANYTISVLFSIMVAHYIWIIVCENISHIDDSGLGIRRRNFKRHISNYT